MDHLQGILSQKEEERNAALKSLYMNPMINAKVKAWSKLYNLTQAEPDDILQEAIIMLDEKIRKGSFLGKSKVTTFLLGICHNMIRDKVRRVNRVILKPEFNDSEQMPESQFYDQLELVETSEWESERDRTLEQLLNGLDSKCREALKSYYFLRMSMAQIAERRGLKNAVQAKKAVHRCRMKLRDLIQSSPALLQKLKPLA